MLIFKRLLTPVLCLLFLAPLGFSQTPSIQAKQDRPKFEETAQPRVGGGILSSARVAPVGPVHCLAETEESEGVMTNWWNYDLVNRLQEAGPVYIVVDNASEQSSWTTYLTSNGVPMTNIDWIMIPTNTVWTRDYGPWFIFDGNNEIGIVDYDANPSSTYGPQDNAYPYAFSQMFGVPYYDMNIEHVGGNWFPHGYGEAFSTTRVYSMNPLTPKTDIDTLHNDYLGIEKYHTVPVAPWTIEHHDCWGKPVSPDTMIVVQYEEDSSYHAYGEIMNAYYATLESPWGRPYKIHRLPMFKMGAGWYEYKPYMNSLISNKRVYVPITGSADDAVAMGVFQDALPGYEVVGVDHLGMGFNDALHCRTRNFMRRDPIRIYLQTVPGDTEETAAAYAVTAEILPPNGASLLSGYPVVKWTETGGAPFNDAVMLPTGTPNEYGVDLPAKPWGTTVSYYIEAKDDGGRSALYPIVAPDGLLSFSVSQDTTAPVLSRALPARSASAQNWPPRIRTLCKDDRTAPEVTVEYAINGVPQPDATLQREEGCYWYGGTLAGTVSEGDMVTYRIVASDDAAVPNTSAMPVLGEIYCPVSGPGSVAVVDLDDYATSYSAEFIQENLEKMGVPCVRYESWPTDWSQHDIWFFCLGVFWDRHILSNAEANDLVAALQAGNNIYMESADAWCYDPERAVYDPWFGVDEIADGNDIYGYLNGQSGTIMEGVSIEYRHESFHMDDIGALSPAKVILRTSDNRGRAVQYDAGTYKTVASSIPLGGCIYHGWPNTRKEALVRILEFLGYDGIGCYIGSEARLGKRANLLIRGNPGDLYLLLASRAEYYYPTDYGPFRIDPLYYWIPSTGVIPSEGVVNLNLTVPSNPAKVGKDFHFQALVGENFDPGVAHLTNREIVTIVE